MKKLSKPLKKALKEIWSVSLIVNSRIYGYLLYVNEPNIMTLPTTATWYTSENTVRDSTIVSGDTVDSMTKFKDYSIIICDIWHLVDEKSMKEASGV